MAQDLHELPDAWSWMNLETCVQKTQNIAPKSQPKTVFSYVDISSINRDTHSIEEPKILNGEDAPSRAKKEIKLGDILFATTRPNLKNIAVYERELANPIASTGFCVLRPEDHCLSRFLFHFLTTDMVQSQISGHVTGAQYPAITDRNLKKTSVPIPPLTEQERIVAKLDALFTRIDQAITRLEDTKTKAQALFESFLDSQFLSEVTRHPLSELAQIKGGKRLPKGKKLLDEKSPYPYIRVSDFNNEGSINLGKIKYLSEDVQDEIKPIYNQRK